MIVWGLCEEPQTCPRWQMYHKYSCVSRVNSGSSSLLLCSGTTSAEGGERVLFCTGRAWPWSTGLRLLAQKLTPESSGLAGWTFRVESVPSVLSAENRPAGIPDLSCTYSRRKRTKNVIAFPMACWYHKSLTSRNWVASQRHSLCLPYNPVAGKLSDSSQCVSCGKRQEIEHMTRVGWAKAKWRYSNVQGLTHSQETKGH